MYNQYIFADISLSRRLEQAEGLSNAAFIDARAKTFPDRKASWCKVGGTMAMYDGATSPLTQTFGLGLFDTPTTKDLEELESFFISGGSHTYHEVSPLADSATWTLLNQRNYHPIEFTSLLYQNLPPGHVAPIEENKALKVKICHDDEQAIWTKTIVEGWSEFAEFAPLLNEMGEVNAVRTDVKLFLAELEGHAIAAGLLSIHEGVALLAGASTIPSGRRHGAQLALLQSRLQYAREQGCDLAMMGAAPGSSSQRNAERNGFRIAYTRIKWHKAL